MMVKGSLVHQAGHWLVPALGLSVSQSLFTQLQAVELSVSSLNFLISEDN